MTELFKEFTSMSLAVAELKVILSTHADAVDQIRDIEKRLTRIETILSEQEKNDNRGRDTGWKWAGIVISILSFLFVIANSVINWTK